MRFISTRGRTAPHSFSDAVAAGLAPDGGLFLPETLPDFSGDLVRFASLGYRELCFEFLRRFATDIPADTLRSIVARSHTHFENPETAVLRPLGGRVQVLELFHGPTLAFKDFGLQLLGTLYEHQCRVRHESINALGATSGDTGAAAIHGLLGKPGTGIFILYPDGRVSPLQERQMACTGADNVFALSLDGTFDDAQAVLKEVLGDREFRNRHRLSAVNSINLARLLAQSVYYLYAWLRLSPEDRADAEFVVPTGNFGNVLAGWLLSRMGVPIAGFKVATNQNDILHRFFRSGEYRIGPVRPSHAPSMDVQAASNFERFLYYALKGDGNRVEAALREFKTSGVWKLDDLSHSIGPKFTSSACSDAEIADIIRRVYRDYGYVVDPHTACGFKDLSPARASVVLATASPAKFPETIRAAIGIEPTHPSLEALKSRPIVKFPIKADAAAVRGFIERHAVE
jgi:threonine synthase